ncbi:MAG: hypothetical protein AAF357_02050 [Verrucomicrobiota bacterium]
MKGSTVLAFFVLLAMCHGEKSFGESPDLFTQPRVSSARVEGNFTQFADIKGQPIAIRVEIRDTRLAADEPPLVETVMVAHAGQEAVFESLRTLSVPSRWLPAKIPEGVEAKGGGVRGADSVVLETSETGVFEPAHPTDFERRSVGLRLVAIPHVSGDGSISVDLEVERSCLAGFSESGVPIEEVLAKRLAKGKRLEARLKNPRFTPVFLEQSTALEFSGERPRLQLAEVRKDSPLVLSEFGEDFSAENLPPVTISVTASRISEVENHGDFSDGDRIYVTTRFVEISEEGGSDSPTHLLFGDEQNAILTDPQFQVLVRSLTQKRGVDLLSAPSIMLKSGESGRVEITRDFVAPTQYEPPSGPEDPQSPDPFIINPATPTAFERRTFGISLDVAARNRRGGMIDVSIRLLGDEVEGFLNFGEPIYVYGDGSSPLKRPVLITENRIETPVFRERKVSTDLRIRDGATVCLVGPIRVDHIDIEEKPALLGSLPLIGKAVTKHSTETVQRQLYIFVKAQRFEGS